jgi:AraC-like DNA-binding protein
MAPRSGARRRAISVPVIIVYCDDPVWLDVARRSFGQSVQVVARSMRDIADLCEPHATAAAVLVDARFGMIENLYTQSITSCVANSPTPFVAIADISRSGVQAAFQLAAREWAGVFVAGCDDAPGAGWTVIRRAYGRIAQRVVARFLDGQCAPQVVALLAYAAEHACEGLSVHEISRAHGMNRRTLNRHLALQHAPSAGAILETGQIVFARSMLVCAHPVRKVAAELGYRTLRSFRRMVVRRAGVTPSRLRQADVLARVFRDLL